LIGKKKKQYFKKHSKKIDTASKPNEEAIELEETEEILMILEDEIVIKTEELTLVTEELLEKPPISIAAVQTITKKPEISGNMSLKCIKDYKQILPLSSKAHRLHKTKSLIDCQVLFETIYENPNFSDGNFEEKFELSNFNLNNNYDEKQFLNLYLFGNRKSTIELLDLENEELKSSNVMSTYCWLFDVWKGNIEKLMFELESNNLINDFFFTLYQISITPTIYQDNKFFDTFLQQLLASNEFHKVALYYIVSYKIHDAIELYLRHNQFQFALCLAQLRLDKTLTDDNELFRKVLLRYAVYAAYNGDYETAVLAYIRIKDLANASMVLVRRMPANDEQKVLIQNLTNKFSKHDPSICVENETVLSENRE
jgi:hypothetical protein